jgi:hypothetical protein
MMNDDLLDLGNDLPGEGDDELFTLFMGTADPRPSLPAPQILPSSMEEAENAWEMLATILVWEF